MPQTVPPLTTYRFSRLPPATPFRRCTCGECIPTLAAWLELPLAGFQSNDGECLELRSHACGTTLARVVVEHPDDVLSRLGIDAVHVVPRAS